MEPAQAATPVPEPDQAPSVDAVADYAVLGIHGEDVPSVDKVTTVKVPMLDAEGRAVMTEDGVTPQTQDEQKIEQRNVVRVRMLIGDQMIDEDFTLPRIITIEEQIEEVVRARIAEIETNGPDPTKSAVIPEQTEQIIQENPDV